MRAIRVQTPGGPEVLTVGELPLRGPAPGEVLVKLDAAGVNFIDIYHRTGLYPLPLPFTPGLEGAGTVLAVGDAVTSVRVGERVAWTGVPGAYAEQALLPADRLVTLPEGLSTRQGAAMMLQGLTAHYLACTTRPLGPDDTCLVHAAAGGVGLLLCQIAKLRGARVIATVSTEEKAALARGAGADLTILYGHQDFVAETLRATDGRGVQVIYDGVGKTTFLRGFDCLAPRGMMVLYGQASGPVEAFDPQLLAQRGSLFLTRPSLFHYVARREELVARAGEVSGWILADRLHLRIEREYPLAEAAAAHRALAGRETTGKVLLIP